MDRVACHRPTLGKPLAPWSGTISATPWDTPRFLCDLAPLLWFCRVVLSIVPRLDPCSFNQLDLPEYESFEQLRNALHLAISEASEGFGFG